MVVGSECTFWYAKEKGYCGRATSYLQRDRQTGELLNVLCAEHRAGRCEPLLDAWDRAPLSRAMQLVGDRRQRAR